ncbi:MAG: CBS domain-containing protein [Deltaproteobacteria bacterium]|nr:CBS domain-containing protein [Deltaproteobacteria bacterium]
MPLKDIVRGKVVSCRPDNTILEAAEVMKRNDVGCLLVIQDDKPEGVLTDRDIVLRCIAGHIAPEAPVIDIMTRGVASVTVDDGIQDVINLMRAKEIRRVPVLEKDGRVIGLVSFGDIVGLLAKELGDLSAATPVRASRAA